MIGTFIFTGLRDRLSQVTSHESGESRGSHGSEEESNWKPIKQHVPFIASPLDPKTTQWLQQKHATSNLTLKRRPTVAQQEANRVSGGIFRKQKEASPLELFFDLFFVANLAVYSFNNSVATRTSVGNYIGFFSLMWTYWFHVSIYDVRFYVDSILNRYFKLCQFVIFVTFTGLAPLYDAIEEGGPSRSFRGLAMVYMTSRLILLIQYGVVLWYVRPFKKTVVPLALMMLVYLCAAMAFLGSFIQASMHMINGVEGQRHIVVWYVIVGVEAVLVILISTFWRVLSFKRTHLIERVGLLTLIIMGEGIIGLVKSIATILDGTMISIWNATGRVISSVFLIYLIYVLYFTPIAHDRFGTIRQQFWVLLHLPLHVALLLTVEGSAETLLWTTILNARYRLVGLMPSLTEPSTGYATANAVITRINNTMTNTNSLYTYYKLSEKYNWLTDISRLQNLTNEYEYASSEWNKAASEILSDMVNETSNYFFENFKFEGPYDIKYVKDPNEKLDTYFKSMVVIFTCFYVSAGVLLLILAAMYWLGKNNKSREEWFSIAPRFIIGFALPFISIAAYKSPWDHGFMFRSAGWIVSVVVFCYLAVVIVDNVTSNMYDKRRAKLASAAKDAEQGHLTGHEVAHNNVFGPAAFSEHDSSSGTMIARDYAHAEKGSMSPDRNAGLAHSKTIRFDESDGLVSGEPTLSGRRDSEQPSPSPQRKPIGSAPRSKQIREHDDDNNEDGEWQEQQTYYIPPIHFQHGSESEVDAGRNEYANHPSFENEVMMSPRGPTTAGPRYS